MDVPGAIERLQRFLYSKQDPETGNWEFRSREGGLKRDRLQVGGETALVTLGLLQSGEPAQGPGVARAISYLRSLQPVGTYAVSVRAHVWASLPPEYLPLLELDASWLVEAAKKHELGLFDYESVRSDYVDNSVTHYGILGLWEASRRGFKVPDRFWRVWLEHFLSQQRDDGSWVYQRRGGVAIGGEGSGNIFDSPGTGAQTVTGLMTLLVAQQELYRDRTSPEPTITQAISRAMGWLDRHFDVEAGGGGYNHYYLYGVERVAQATGVRVLNGLDWYAAGARQIVKGSKVDGWTEHDSIRAAFALMFLSQGRHPVWVSKIRLAEARWNNHPNDLYFGSLHLSRLRELRHDWQVVGIDEPVEKWLTAPVAFVSSDQGLALTWEQEETIRRYINRGGLLVTSADHGSEAFNRSVREMAKRLYPRYTFGRLRKGHPLLRVWYPIEPGEARGVATLSNGARDLIVMVGGDFGYRLQSERDLGRAVSGRLLANLFAYVTDRGVVEGRVVDRAGG